MQLVNNIIEKIMETKKQSSIEWLESELKYLLEKYRNFEVSEDEFVAIQNQLFNDAKEKHKKEIMDGYLDGFEDGEDSTHDKPKYKSAEQYYNLTFNPQENGKV